MRRNCADTIKKYRILIAAEILILAVLGLFLIFKKSYSFSLTPDMLVYIPSGVPDEYVTDAGNGLLSISVPEDGRIDSCNLYIWEADIPFGIYNGEIRYSTVYDLSAGNHPLVSFVTFDDAGDTDRFSDDVLLYDQETVANFRIYSGKATGKFHSFITLNGSGKAVIDSVTVKEYMPWRILIFLIVIITFAAVDYFIVLFAKYDRKKKYAIMILSLLTLAVSYPYFAGYSLNGHDIQFHMYRIGSLAEELMNGHFPVRYMSGAYNGYGYIIHILYGNFFLLPAAFLYILGAPIYAAYNFCLFLINTLTVAISYHSFKKVFGGMKWGILGSFLYTASMYRMCDQYIRSDIGEAFAMAFLPLVVYGLYRIYTENRPSKIREYIYISFPLVMGITGIIQSHILTTMMTGFMIFVFCLLAFPKTIRHIKELLFSAFSVLIINLFYLVPVFASYVLNGLTSTEADMDRDLKSLSLLFEQIFDPLFVTGTSAKEGYSQGDMFFGPGPVALIGLVVLVVCILINIRKKTGSSGKIKTGIWFLAMALISCFISSALFPWGTIQDSNGILGLFKSIQFPWRFMEMADPMLCFAAVSGFAMLSDTVNKQRIYTFVYSISIILIIVTGFVFAKSYAGYAFRLVQRDNFVSVIPDWTIFPEGCNRFMTYDTGLKSSADINLVRYPSGEAVMTEGTVSYEVLTERSDEKTYRIINGANDTKVSLPVFYLDNLAVMNELSGERIKADKSDDGLTCISIGAGEDLKVSVAYRIPIYWRICDIISLVWIIMVIRTVYVEKMRNDR